MKVIKSLENRGILLKETTRKIESQKGGFLNFLRAAVTASLPLLISKVKPLSKRFFVTTKINDSNRCNIFLKKLWTSNNRINNF